jgi:hypothetical protein
MTFKAKPVSIRDRVPHGKSKHKAVRRITQGTAVNGIGKPNFELRKAQRDLACPPTSAQEQAIC